MKNIVVTGATGQLGRRLVAVLAQHGDTRIHCIGRDRQRSLDLLGRLADVDFLDAEDTSGCDAALRGMDVLIHAAFARGNNGRALAESLDFSRRVFERACAIDTAAIINVSSQSVYGTERTAPSTEADAADPGDRYAVAKYASELLLETIAAGTSTRFTHVRLASLIGEGMDERLVTKFVVQAMGGHPLRIQGGNQRFSFMDIDDAAAGLACMLEVPADRWKRLYNLGPLGSHSLMEIARATAGAVEAASGTPVGIEVTPHHARQDATMDSSTFQRDFGFVARIDLATTLRGIIGRLSC